VLTLPLWMLLLLLFVVDVLINLLTESFEKLKPRVLESTPAYW